MTVLIFLCLPFTFPKKQLFKNIYKKNDSITKQTYIDTQALDETLIKTLHTSNPLSPFKKTGKSPSTGESLFYSKTLPSIQGNSRKYTPSMHTPMNQKTFPHKRGIKCKVLIPKTERPHYILVFKSI